MNTHNGGVRFEAASARIPSSESVLLPRILLLVSIQYADGRARIDWSVDFTVPVAVEMEVSSSC